MKYAVKSLFDQGHQGTTARQDVYIGVGSCDTTIPILKTVEASEKNNPEEEAYADLTSLA